jgi:superfamily II DNA or RNA helicase
MQPDEEHGPLLGAIITLVRSWVTDVSPRIERLRAELSAPPAYVRGPRLEDDPPLRVTAEFCRSPTRDDSVAAVFEKKRLTFRCSCPAAGVCVHGETLAVDLAACAEFRGELDGTLPLQWTATLRAARDRWRSIGQEHRAIEQWLGRAPSSASGFDIEVEPLSFIAASPSMTAALRLVVRSPPPNRRMLAAHELPSSPVDRRLRAVLRACEPDWQGRKAFLLPRVASGTVVEELATLGARLSNGPALTVSATEAHVALGYHDAEDGALMRRTGVSITHPVLAARWMIGDAPAPARSVLFDGVAPVLLDTTTGRIHRVDPRTDDAMMSRASEGRPLVLGPTANKAALLRGLRALVAPRGAALPSVESMGLPPRETPTFALAIDGTTLDLRIALRAKYSVDTVTVAPPGVVTPLDAADTHRDVDAELSAREQLVGLGLSSAADGLGWTLAHDEAARFWLELLPAIEKAMPALAIEVPAALTKARVDRRVFSRIRVTYEKDWFDVTSKFSVDDAMDVEFDKLREAVLGRRRFVALRDGTLARITDAVANDVEELLEVLGAQGAREGRGTVARYGLGAIERLADREGVLLDVAAQKLRETFRAVTVSPSPRLPKDLRAELRPYQLTAVAWLEFLEKLRCGGVLADDMGLGKTLVTLAWLAAMKERAGPSPSLVIAPASVLVNWQREASRFTPSLEVSVLHGVSRWQTIEELTKKRSTVDVAVTSYGLLRRDIDALRSIRWRAAIFDEAQFVKNADTTSAECARLLTADTRLALTGTPVENHLGELWSIVDLVLPGMLGTQRSFEQRYRTDVDDSEKAVASVNNVERLRGVIRPFMLRRTKREVLTELPAKQEIDRVVAMTKKQRALYDKLAAVVREEVRQAVAERGIERSALNVLTALLRLRQLSCDPRLLSDRVSAKESGKREAFLELVRGLRDEGRRALVFSQFVSLLTLWRKDLDRERIRYEYLDGSTTDRAERVTRFQEGDATLFLISLKAGGTGLNLTAADTVIHIDPWWNPAVEEQATDRAYRMGQQRKVTVYRLIAEGTVEEKIQRLKQHKRAIAEAVVQETPGALRGLTEEDIALLLSESEGDASDDGEASDDGDGSDEVEARGPSRKRGRGR